MGKLTDIQIRSWIKAGAPVAKSDGDGLTFTLSAKGTAAWTLRYRHGGQRKELTIGRYPDITLARAREIASAKRAEVQQGVDVAREKRKAAQEAARAWTFARLTEEHLTRAADYLAESTIAGRRQQLRDYAFPRLGNMKAADILPADIVEVVEACAGKSVHLARVLLIGIREVFAFGIAKNVIPANPCAHITGRAVIGGRPEQRKRVMLTDAELSILLPALENISRHNGLMVRILLATGARIGELTKAEWKHVDFEQATWTIPSENSKTKVPFVVPLAPQVLSWFADLQPLSFGSRFVFPVRTRQPRTEGDKHMDPATLNAALNRLALTLDGQVRRFSPHDLRSTCRSHLGALGVDVLVCERCLNHSLGGLVAIYDKHDYLTERRRALELWAAKIAALERGEAFNVLPMRRAS